MSPHDIARAVAVVVADRLDGPAVGLAVAECLPIPCNEINVGIAWKVGDGDAANDSASLHEPNTDGAGGGILKAAALGALSRVQLAPVAGMSPQNVRIAVAVEVTDTLDAPTGVGAAGKRGAVRHRAIGVHEPCRQAACARLLPYDVGDVVLIEIADADDVPVGARGVLQHRAVRNGGAAHEPNGDFAGDVISPQNIGGAVMVEIRDGLNAPVTARAHRDRQAHRNEIAVHQPDDEFIGAGIAPQHVGIAVAVEIPDALEHPRGGGTGRDFGAAR